MGRNSVAIASIVLSLLSALPARSAGAPASATLEPACAGARLDVTVLDNADASAVSGAVVVVSGPDQGAARSLLTDHAGRAMLCLPAAGKVKVHVSMDGYDDLVKSNVRVTAGTTRRITMRLEAEASSRILPASFSRGS